MKNSAHKVHNSPRPAFSRKHTVFLRRHAVAAALSVLAVFAIQTPEVAHGQGAGYYTQNGGVVWYGAQQQAHHPGTRHYAAPGYVQHPAHSQPAVRGTYAPGGYPGAANAAPANQYGGTTAWQQPGFVPQTYQQNPAYGVSQQPYGYYQPAPNYGNGQTSGYGQTFVDRQRQQYAQSHAYPGHGYGYPVTGYPSYSTPPAGHPAYAQQPPHQGQQQYQQGQQYQQQGQQQYQYQYQQGQQLQTNQRQNPHVQNQLTPVQQAARQAATNVSPNGVPVLSPAAAQFFQNLQGPNRSTYNQNQQNYSFSGQARPSNQIPNTTWQSGSRFGQTYSNRSNHNQTTTNQNRFNYSLHNLTRPGLRGY